MKKFSWNKISFQQLFDNDIFVRVFAVIVAIVAWFAVSISQTPERNRTIVNVPVSINYEGSIPQTLGLQRIGDTEFTVTVYVTGKNSKVQKLTEDDFIATVSLNNVNQAKEYTLPIEVTKKTEDSDYRINSWSNTEITLTFDKIVTRQMTLEVSTPKLSAADGYILEKPYADVETITVSGPQNVVNRIDRCVMTLDNEGELTDSLTASGAPTLLDKNGAAVVSEYLTIDPGTVEVTVPVYRTKKLTLEPQFVNVPKGFPLDKLRYTLSQNAIMVAAANDIVDNQDSVILGPIDFRTVDIGKEMSLDVTLPAGFINTENVSSVTITFPTYGLTSKNFSVPRNNFVFENVPTGYEAVLATGTLENVKIVGDSTVLSGMSSDDLVATIDLSQVTAKKGQYTVPVRVYCQNRVLAWAVGEYTTVIALQEKAAE